MGGMLSFMLSIMVGHYCRINMKRIGSNDCLIFQTHSEIQEQDVRLIFIVKLRKSLIKV